MNSVDRPDRNSQNSIPRAVFIAASTIWIVTIHADGFGYAVFHGARTREALTKVLEKIRKSGNAVRIELETRSCSPTPMTIEDLVALGVLS